VKTADEAIHDALDSLRGMRDDYRSKGDLVSYRLVDRCMMRVARSFNQRNDPGRRGDDPEDTRPGALTPRQELRR
jgi:hypothetical protein